MGCGARAAAEAEEEFNFIYDQIEGNLPKLSLLTATRDLYNILNEQRLTKAEIQNIEKALTHLNSALAEGLGYNADYYVTDERNRLYFLL